MKKKNIVGLGLLVFIVLVGFSMTKGEDKTQNEEKNLEHGGTVSYEDGKIIVGLTDGIATNMDK